MKLKRFSTLNEDDLGYHDTTKGLHVWVQDEVLDYSGGQTYCRIVAYADDKVAGKIDYSLYGNQVYIDYNGVYEKYGTRPVKPFGNLWEEKQKGI
jgi:hypothetical protein